MLTTDWITIGTAGPTIDGRKISENLLNEAADDYDPEEYTAVISSDHMLWMFGNFGQVHSLRTNRDKKDRLTLQAKIIPNGRLIQMNKEGQRLFTSMELTDDFAGSGRGYLMGLAVTDEPASVGTSRLQFSKQEPAPFLLNTPEPFRISFPKTVEDEHTLTCTGNQDEQGFRRFMKTIWQTLSNTEEKPQPLPSEDEDMTEEQFNTLKTLHEQQLTALQELTTLTKEARGDQGDGGTDAGDAGKGGKDTPDNFSELKTSFESLASSITELKSQVTELADTAKPGTQVPTSTGAPDSAAQFV